MASLTVRAMSANRRCHLPVLRYITRSTQFAEIASLSARPRARNSETASSFFSQRHPRPLRFPRNDEKGVSLAMAAHIHSNHEDHRHSHDCGDHHHHHRHDHSHSHSHGLFSHHHHHHHHDKTYLTSKSSSDPGVRITRIGLATNLLMALSKFVGGYAFHSQSLVADAYHSLTDLISDFMTLATVSLSLKPPSERFPLGYGKIESLGALGVSGLLLAGGCWMGLSSLEALLVQGWPELAHQLAHWGIFGHGNGHSHGHELMGPSIHAAWLAAGSILVKETLYRATMKIARERHSSVLASNAVHHRIDSLTSVVSLTTIAGSHILPYPGAAYLDPIGGLLISLMVIKAGYENTYSSLLELADSSLVAVDSEMAGEIKAVIEGIVGGYGAGTGAHGGGGGDGVLSVRNVTGTKAGQNYLLEVDIETPSSWSLQQTAEVERGLKSVVAKELGSKGVRRLLVRFVPQGRDATDPFVYPETEKHEHDRHDGHSSHTSATADRGASTTKRR